MNSSASADVIQTSDHSTFGSLWRRLSAKWRSSGDGGHFLHRQRAGSRRSTLSSSSSYAEPQLGAAVPYHDPDDDQYSDDEDDGDFDVVRKNMESRHRLSRSNAVFDGLSMLPHDKRKVTDCNDNDDLNSTYNVSTAASVNRSWLTRTYGGRRVSPVPGIDSESDGVFTASPALRYRWTPDVLLDCEESVAGGGSDGAVMDATNVLSARSLLYQSQRNEPTASSSLLTSSCTSNGTSGNHVNGAGEMSNGASSRPRSMRTTGECQGQSHHQTTKSTAVFDIRRDLLASLADSGDADRLRTLLKADCTAVNAADEFGNTALHKAAIKGHSHAVRYLLLYGADIELKNAKGYNSLFTAVEYGRQGAVGVLLDFMHSTNSRVPVGDSYVVDRVKTCHEIKPFRRRHIDYVQLMICHGQKVHDLTSFLGSVVDVPIGHAYFINNLGAEFSLKNVNKFNTGLHLLCETITIYNSRLRAMNTIGYHQLRSLILVDCGLTQLVLDAVESLETLDVRRNRLTSLPDSIGRCRRLRTVRVASNELRRLPGRPLGALRRLVAFDCSFNRLKRLPNHLVQCTGLTSLECNDNCLVELPVDIGLLVCLEELRAANNRLSLLPVSISALTRLRRITFQGNPLQNIPPDFPERAQDVRQYLQSLQEDPVPNRTVKLVVVGQEGVGKTTLLKAIKRTSWIIPHGSVETASTDGVDVREIQLHDVTLRCFDCGGDVDFSETHNFFMTSGAIYLVCFNLAEYCMATVERDSFLLGRLQLWLQYIFTKVPDAQVLVVGTHADHPSLNRSVLEQIWNHLRLLFVGAREHHRRYFLPTPCSSPLNNDASLAKKSFENVAAGDVPADASSACGKFVNDEDDDNQTRRFCSERLTDCLLCQDDASCYRRSMSVTGTSGGYVNLGFAPAISGPLSPTGGGRQQPPVRSISTIEEETGFSSSETSSVTFPHVVGYYEVSSVRPLTSATATAGSDSGTGNGVAAASGAGKLNRGIEHLKAAIGELATRLIKDNPEIPRRWARVEQSLMARRQRDDAEDTSAATAAAAVGQMQCSCYGNDCCKLDRATSCGCCCSSRVGGGPISTLDDVAKIASIQGVTDRRELVNMLHFFKAQGGLLYFPQLADLDEIVILDPVWLARIFAAVMSRDNGVDEYGFISREQLCATWQTAKFIDVIAGESAKSTTAHVNLSPSKLRDRRILALLRHFGLCLPVEGTNWELFPSRLPLGDLELDPAVWHPLPDPKHEKQVTYSVTFPSIIPPPFFNSLIAEFYSYRSHGPPPKTTCMSLCMGNRDGDDSPTMSVPVRSTFHYYADRFVDWLRLDRAGCSDCCGVGDVTSDPGNTEEVVSPPIGDSHNLYHRIFVELIAHRRTIQVTARGDLPCCAIKKVCRIFHRVIRQFDGLGNIELDSIVCPGCVLMKSQVKSTTSGPGDAVYQQLQQHNFSVRLLAAMRESSNAGGCGPVEDRLRCSNGHVSHSIRDLMCGVISESLTLHSPAFSLMGTTSVNGGEPIRGSCCPRLFILLPVNRYGLSFDRNCRLFASTLVPDGYAVHLLCEFPDGYHVTAEPGYRLRSPSEFVRRYGGHVIWTLRLLARLADSSAVSAKYAARTRAVARTADSIIKDLVAKFPQLKTAVQLDPSHVTAAANGETVDSPYAYSGQLLTNLSSVRREELRGFLRLADHRADVFGPLRRFQCRSGGTGDDVITDKTLWLCAGHARQMDGATLCTSDGAMAADDCMY